ncbi:MAG: ATP-binding cassette domain-containing protein [Pseudomonadota bacterium]
MPAELSSILITAPSGARILGPLTALLEPGSLGIVGASGSGKSTLLRLLAGRLGDGWSVKGKLWHRGRAIDGKALPGSALVSQDAQSGLDPVARVGRLLRWAAGETGDVRATLGSLDLDVDAIAPKRAAELSGGMRQRVLLAMGLLRARQFLLLDEPSSALDDANAERLAAAVSLWSAASEERSVVVVSHDVGWLRRHCGSIWVMDQGSVHELNDPRSQPRFLSAPGVAFESALRRLEARP